MATQDALRFSILRAAYTEYPKWVDREFLLRVVKNVVAEELDRQVFYLEEKGAIRVNKAIGQPWTELQITAAGIDVIDGKVKL